MNASDITVYFGDVMCAYYLLKMALIAETRLGELGAGNGAEDSVLNSESARKTAQTSEEARFYYNKIKTAEHYVFQILPRAKAIAAKVQSRNFAALEALLEEVG